jgi:hypothetical protein
MAAIVNLSTYDYSILILSFFLFYLPLTVVLMRGGFFSSASAQTEAALAIPQ